MPYYEHLKCLSCGIEFAAVTQHYYGLGKIIDENICPKECHSRCVRTALDIPAQFTDTLSIQCGSIDILDTKEAQQAISGRGYDPHYNKQHGVSTQLTNKDL